MCNIYPYLIFTPCEMRVGFHHHWQLKFTILFGTTLVGFCVSILNLFFFYLACDLGESPTSFIAWDKFYWLSLAFLSPTFFPVYTTSLQCTYASFILCDTRSWSIFTGEVFLQVIKDWGTIALIIYLLRGSVWFSNLPFWASGMLLSCPRREGWTRVLMNICYTYDLH